MYLMDTESIGGDDHRTPLYRTPLICNEEVNFASAGIWGSLATWEDAKGTRWVLTPFWGPKHSKFKAPIEHGAVKNGAIVAFKVEEKAGKCTLTPAWISRDMNRAEPPVIANGVIFAYGSGEDTDQARIRHRPGLQPRRISHQDSTKAVLYALDAQTGKELWNRAATRSLRGTTGAGYRSPTAAFISTPLTVSSIASGIASGERRSIGSERSQMMKRMMRFKLTINSPSPPDWAGWKPATHFFIVSARRAQRTFTTSLQSPHWRICFLFICQRRACATRRRQRLDDRERRPATHSDSQSRRQDQQRSVAKPGAGSCYGS